MFHTTTTTLFPTESRGAPRMISDSHSSATAAEDAGIRSSSSPREARDRARAVMKQPRRGQDHLKRCRTPPDACQSIWNKEHNREKLTTRSNYQRHGNREQDVKSPKLHPHHLTWHGFIWPHLSLSKHTRYNISAVLSTLVIPLLVLSLKGGPRQGGTKTTTRAQAYRHT